MKTHAYMIPMNNVPPLATVLHGEHCRHCEAPMIDHFDLHIDGPAQYIPCLKLHNGM